MHKSSRMALRTAFCRMPWRLLEDGVFRPGTHYTVAGLYSSYMSQEAMLYSRMAWVVVLRLAGFDTCNAVRDLQDRSCRSVGVRCCSGTGVLFEVAGSRGDRVPQGPDVWSGNLFYDGSPVLFVRGTESRIGLHAWVLAMHGKTRSDLPGRCRWSEVVEAVFKEEKKQKLHGKSRKGRGRTRKRKQPYLGDVFHLK